MTSVKSDIRIYVDLEYCFPGMTRAIGRPSENDLRQVVQIAAIKYNHTTGEELAAFNTLVRPPFTHPLPDFFVELTDITQAQVDATGQEFENALDEFVAFCDQLPIYTFDKDWNVLEQNCGYHKIDYPFEDMPFTRVKALLSPLGISEEYSSGTLYKAAGLKMDGHVHNALHDVRSMAAAIHALIPG